MRTDKEMDRELRMEEAPETEKDSRVEQSKAWIKEPQEQRAPEGLIQD